SHTHLFLRGDHYFVEDLGSLLGSYLNGNKLVPHQPAIIRSDDQLVIFPYVFTIKIEPIWAPESNIQLHTGSAVPSSWNDFIKGAPIGLANFFVTAYPTNQCVGLQIDRSFVNSILDRALTPLGVPSSPGGASDTGLLALLALGVLQNVNKRLASQLQ